MILGKARRIAMAGAMLAACMGADASAQGQATEMSGGPGVAMPVAITPFEPVNPGGMIDRLGEARRLAAIIVAQGLPSPHMVADVGSFTGEFLEAFMERFPAAKGQWTEPVDNNQKVAERRFARFGNRVSYRIGCAGRDIALGCLPDGVDVLLSSWLTIHRDSAGIEAFHRKAFEVLPHGGWVAIIDHAGFATGAAPEPWAGRLQSAREDAVRAGLAMLREGPPVHHPDYITPPLEFQMEAMRKAGFESPRLVWARLDTVLIMARKP